MGILTKHELDIESFEMPSSDDPLAKYTNVAIFRDIQTCCKQQKELVESLGLDIDIKVRNQHNYETRMEHYTVYAISSDQSQLALLKINS